MNQRAEAEYQYLLSAYASLLQILQKILNKAKDIKDRNKLIVKSYQQGYTQHMIAKVLGVSQAAIYGVIKRSRK